MSTHSYQFKYYRSVIAIGAVCLAATLLTLATDMSATAQNRRAKSKYGLGTLPVAARTGGGIRTPKELPRVILLAPQDGGITLSERPTFYWYVAPKSGDRDFIPFRTAFKLDDPIASSNVKTFEIKRDGTKIGLYSLTLPPTAPAMEIGKDLELMVQDKTNALSSQKVVVRLKKNEAAIAELNKAKTSLDKARIYERHGYWYDALHSYTLWIEGNPNDITARRERANMIEVGLKDNCDFREIKAGVPDKCDFHEDGQPNLKLLGELQSKIDGTAAVDLASFPPEIKR